MGRVVTRPVPDSGRTVLPRCGPEDLFEGERLLLWMLRQWVAARVLEEDPRARLAAFAGPYVSPRGAAAFVMLMTAIEERVRRPLCVSHPDCLGYARDEQHLVTACGVSPAAPDVAARLLDDLVVAPSVIAALVRVVNFSLAREGFNLPLRFNDSTHAAEPQPCAPARPTLH